MKRTANPHRDEDMDSPVLLAQPVVHWLLTALFGTILLGGLAIAVLGSYSRRETVRGEVVARDGFTTIAADRAGTVVELKARLGERVRAGQLLAVVQIPRIVASSGDTAVMTIARLQRMRANMDLQAADLERSLREWQGQLAELNATSDTSLRSIARNRRAVEGQRQIAERRLQALDTLVKSGFATETTLDQLRSAILQLDQSVASSDLRDAEVKRARADRLASMHAEERALRQGLLDLRNQRLQIDTQIHDLESQEFVRIVAPASGEIRASSVRPGQRIESGDRIFALAQPGSDLVVSLDAPSAAIGFIEPGQRVVLKYDAFPYQAFGIRYGTVSAVQQVSLDPDEPASEKSQGRRFRVEVRPDSPYVQAYGQARPLKIGMALTAEVTLEKRRLIDWLLEPLYSMRGQIS